MQEVESSHVDAHVAHGAADNYFINAVLVEDGFQVALAEGVDVVLQHDGFVVARVHLGMDLGAFPAGREEWRFGSGELVPNVHDQVPCSTSGR